MEQQIQMLETWAAIVGQWKFEAESVVYLGPDRKSPYPYGIALSKAHLRSGSIETEVRFFERAQDSVGRIIFGYNAETKEYFSSGIGGYDFAYVLDEFVVGRGWKPLDAAGSKENFAPDSEFQVETRIHGQKVSLTVDGIKVLEANLPRTLQGDQLGLFAWGREQVEFKTTKFAATRPKAFVVMEFEQPYDALYTDVIKPVAEEMGLEVYRVDEVYKPGIILQDIIRGLVEAELVIAEITPPNPNVFYELGYGHAMDKTTILLAERGKELPFDVRSHRCIFYDNTIRGKKDVENHLRQHLTTILRGV